MNRIERKARAKDSLACAFTGHRPQKLGYTNEDTKNLHLQLRRELLRLVGKNYTHFLCGGALGFDLVAAEEVLWIRNQLPFVTLEMVLPWPGQSDKWSNADRQRYESIVSKADSVTVIEDEYTKGCLFKRNRFLVDSSDLLLALYLGLPGGTKMTVDYAVKQGREILLVEDVRQKALDKSAPEG